MRVFLFFCVISTACFAQGFPFVLGGVLEIGSGTLDESRYGTGIVRITPFLGVWVNGLGFIKVGANTNSYKETDSTGISSETKRFDISAQIGFSAIGQGRPYISGSYTRSKAYSSNSDAAWNELGLGIGHRFSLSSLAAIVMEVEHRWILEHYNRLRKSDISGRRLQINFGLVAYPF